MVVGELEKVASRRCPVLTTRSTSTIMAVAEQMWVARVGCILVADERGRVVGILTEREIVHRVVAEGRNGLTTTAGEIMITPIAAVKVNTPIPQVFQTMTKHGIRYLPVLEKGAPVAIISDRDILAHELSVLRAAARSNPGITRELEQMSPGITRIQTDECNRIVL